LHNYFQKILEQGECHTISKVSVLYCKNGKLSLVIVRLKSEPPITRTAIIWWHYWWLFEFSFR